MDAKVDDIYTLWRGRMQLCTAISTVLERWTQNLTIFARGEKLNSIESLQIARKKRLQGGRSSRSPISTWRSIIYEAIEFYGALPTGQIGPYKGPIRALIGPYIGPYFGPYFPFVGCLSKTA